MDIWIEDIWIDSLTYSARLLLKMGSIMFVSVFGVELLMQTGLMQRLEPLGKPFYSPTAVLPISA